MELDGIMLSEINWAEKTSTKCFHPYVEYKNKEKLKKQNSSRITETKSGLTVTKGKWTVEDGWVGMDKEGEKERGHYD